MLAGVYACIKLTMISELSATYLLTTPTVVKHTFYVAWVVKIHVCTYVCLCVRIHS